MKGMRRPFLKGALVGGLCGSLVLVASAALAGSGIGGVFNLGVKNSVNRTSSLIGKTAGAMLRVQNKGSGPAASFQVAAGNAPFTVNTSVRVANLNADMLDGRDSSDFYAAGSKVADSFHADNAGQAMNAGDSDKLGGFPAGDYLRGVKVSYVADNPSGLVTILVLGDLTLQAECGSGDTIDLLAYTASDHAWIRTVDGGISDVRLGHPVNIKPGSHTGVLVYHNAAEQVVTLQWASWENGIGKDCQFWGTAFLVP